LADDKNCVTFARRENSGHHGEFVVEERPALSADQQLCSADINNNSGQVRGDKSFVHSDSDARRPVADDSHDVIAAASTVSIASMTEDGVTPSFGDVKASESCPLAVDSEQCQRHDENTCEVLVDYSSDMSIDVDDDELEGAGYICLDVEDYGKEPSRDIPVAATEVVSTQDEG